MKRVFLLLLLLIPFTAGCSNAVTEAEYVEVYDNEDAGDPNIIVENDHLVLTFDGTTTQFSITNKATGAIWYSNPPDAKEDTIAVASAKESLEAQLFLTYGQINGSTTELNNNTVSIINGNYTWEQVENGIKVKYTIGKVAKVYIVPHALSETRLREHYDLMVPDQKRLLDNYYRIIDINKLLATDDKAALLEQYPALETERMFLLREGLQNNIMDRLELAFEETGYNRDDYEADMIAFEAGEETVIPAFNISVIYQLDGADFVVTIPQEEIQYKSKFPILSLAVLPFFGAGGQEDEGFMLVPDSSGGIINFNNGKENLDRYVNNAYGYDYGLKRPAIMNDSSAYFPIFGVNKDDDSFLCIIEEGKEYAGIEADVSGRLNTYNYAYNRYTVLSGEDIDISKANIFAKLFENKPLEGAFSQRYVFVDSSDYVDMAETYRDYLMDKNPSMAKTNETAIPSVIEVIGAIDRTQNILGVPVTVSTPLTTYKETVEMVTKLQESGMENMSVNLVGWFNGGVTHDTPANVKLISKLGSTNDFKSMLSSMVEKDVDLYLQADFTYIYDIGAFNGFSVNDDSAKRISREVSQMYPYSFVWFGQQTGNYGKRNSFYLASPRYTMDAIDSFTAATNKFGTANIAFNAIGRMLNSDFNVNNPTTRDAVLQMQEEKLAKLSASGEKILIHGGNDYAVPYADIIVDMEIDASGTDIVDESIPFYQIVLHGLVPYTGSPVNLAPEYEKSFLKSVETGAGLYFTFMNETGQELQETRYTRYYAADINRWGDEPVNLYKRINDELSHTVNQFIVGYSKLAPDVTLTEYEDGTQVIVNYTDESFMYEGNEVKGMDFAVFR